MPALPRGSTPLQNPSRICLRVCAQGGTIFALTALLYETLSTRGLLYAM